MWAPRSWRGFASMRAFSAVRDLTTAYEGHTGVRPASVVPLAEILRLNGYSTAAFGKWHLTPLWETSVSGPFDRWPTGSVSSSS